MPSSEVGNFSRLAYAAEDVFGVPNTTPTGIILRQTGFDLSSDRDYIDNPELRTDGMKAPGRGGALRGKGSVSGVMSYGTYDDFFAASLGNRAWASDVVKVRARCISTATSLAVDSLAKTFTRDDGGSFVVDGFRVGDRVESAGFTNAGNNTTLTVSAVAALVITFDTSTTLVTEADNEAGSFVLDTRPSFTMERGHLVNGLYFAYPGTVVDGFELGGKIKQAVTTKFNLISKKVSQESRSSVFSAFTQANTNPLMTSWEGSVIKDSVPIVNLVGWDLKSTRNLDIGEVVGSPDLYDVQGRAFELTGSLELYFTDLGLYEDMRTDTDVSFGLNLGPTSGAMRYSLDLTAAKIKNWKSVPKDGMMTATVEIESYAPSSGTNTSCMITRFPS